MRDFIHDLRQADRAVIEAQRAEESALQHLRLISETVTKDLPHAADEARRLDLLNEARQVYARARVLTDAGLDARARVIDDRLMDVAVMLIRDGAVRPSLSLAGASR